VLASIDLDDKVPFPACKIGKIRPDAKLSYELETVESSTAQFMPELFFRIVLNLP
jgi:hypothetical protein